MFDIHNQLGSSGNDNMNRRVYAQSTSRLRCIRNHDAAISGDQGLTSSDTGFNFFQSLLRLPEGKAILIQHLLKRLLPNKDLTDIDLLYQDNQVFDQVDFPIAVNEFTGHLGEFSSKSHVQ